MHIFRKATASDAKAISDLYRELVPAAPISVLPDRIADLDTDRNTYLIVCDLEDKIIATALVTLCADVMFNRQPFALVENVVINKKFQRKGIGKNLMNHIEAFCLAADCSKIMLLSNSDNHSAHHFYTAMGYDFEAKLGFIKKRKNFKH
jgi:N-acetylglutamate synthase-like GNAT family acetyltransferase